MLPKANRLKKKKEFEVVFKKGKTIKEEFLLAKILQKNKNYKKFAFAVSKKISNKAVVRNKIRRRLSALTEKNFLKIKNGVEILFIANPGIEKASYSDIERVVDIIFKKAKIISK